MEGRRQYNDEDKAGQVRILYLGLFRNKWAKWDRNAPGESSSKNEMTSPRVPSSAHSGQTGGQSGIGMLKRKLDACLSVSENKIYNNVDDVHVNGFATIDCSIEKLQMLTHEHDGSPVRHSTTAIPPSSNNAEKFCTSSKIDGTEVSSII